MTTVFHAWAYGRFIEIPDQGSNFLGGNFSNRDNQPQHLRRWFFRRNRPIHFHINSKSVARSVKRWIFLALISKTHFLPWSIVSCRLKFRSQFWLFLEMRNPIKLRVGSSIISIVSNITENIIMKVINVLKEKFRTKNGALRNSSINCKFLWRLPDQNYLKPSITEKRWNKTK